jgi:hypothetical protein
MKRTVALVLAGVALGAFAASLAVAAGPWKVFATATDSGQYGAYASADADVLRPAALAVRVSQAADVSWYMSCQGKRADARPGQLVLVSVATSDKCSLSGSASTTTSGTLRVQLLRRGR